MKKKRPKGLVFVLYLCNWVEIFQVMQKKGLNEKPGEKY